MTLNCGDLLLRQFLDCAPGGTFRAFCDHLFYALAILNCDTANLPCALTCDTYLLVDLFGAIIEYCSGNLHLLYLTVWFYLPLIPRLRLYFALTL